MFIDYIQLAGPAGLGQGEEENQICFNSSSPACAGLPIFGVSVPICGTGSPWRPHQIDRVLAHWVLLLACCGALMLEIYLFPASLFLYCERIIRAASQGCLEMKRDS